MAGLGYVAFGRESASADEVLYQEKSAVGPSPFSPPVDGAPVETPIAVTAAPASTPEGTGPPKATPFGGSGFNNVCKPELMIEFLGKNPDVLKVWAEVLGIDPANYVEYIRSLKSVILTNDLRVTNHMLKNGKAVPFQAILEAGTAVLVDQLGNVVVRCRCGNPLTKPITKFRCKGCPPGYKPPELCPPEVVVVPTPSPTLTPTPTPTPTRTPFDKETPRPTPTPTRTPFDKETPPPTRPPVTESPRPTQSPGAVG